MSPRRPARQKAPAYQWYPKDYISDSAVMAMTLEAQGLYRLLLDVCWLDSGLPMRPHELWRIGRCESLEHFEQLWPAIAPKFYEKDGKYHNRRLDDERKKQANNRKQRQLAADKRWKLEHDARNANALREQCLSSPSSSPTATATPVREKKPRASRVLVIAEGFDAFWDAYPRHAKRAEAEKAWTKLSPDVFTRNAILSALQWQRRLPDWTKDGGQFIPYPASYLNGRRWEDEPPVVSRFAGTSKTAGNLAALQAFATRGNQ